MITMLFKKEGICGPCLVGAIVLVVGAGLMAFLLFKNAANNNSVNVPPALQEEVAAYARVLFAEYQRSGQDLSRGPCLDNGVKYLDWVIDIAHNPRQPIDDEPQNQCSAFREGLAYHFVELDTTGNVLNIY